MSWLTGKSDMKKACWTDGKRTITGRWLYQWAADRFIVELDRPHRTFEVVGDTPEWGKYKLVRETERNP